MTTKQPKLTEAEATGTMIRYAPPNKALQQTLDPATFFAAAKNASASSAAELRR